MVLCRKKTGGDFATNDPRREDLMQGFSTHLDESKCLVRQRRRTKHSLSNLVFSFREAAKSGHQEGWT